MTEMVALIYLRYLLKVAQIIIPENPLCLYFICTTNSLMSALPLCQPYSPEQTVNISFVFLGWTLPGTDLPQLFQPTANTEGISKSHLEILVSHKLSQPLWDLVFPFFRSFQELQMHKTFKHPLPSMLSCQHCTNRGSDRGRCRESCVLWWDALLPWGQLPRWQ